MDPKKIVELTKKYVLSRSQSNVEKLEYYLNEWKYRKPYTINQLFRNLLMHAQNRQGMPNSIGNIDKLSTFLFEFDPKEVYNNYGGWRDLFIKIEKNYTPPGRMEIDNPRNYWVIYSKSIISTAKFLSKFNTFTEFEAYINQFILEDNIDLRIALPLLLSEELFGFRFALSCDFIKENVSPKFIKPDVHIRDVFVAIDLCKVSDSDFDIFRKVVKFANDAEKEPYWIDKLFWLVGSKTFYSSAKYPVEEKINTSKKELIELLKKEAK